MSRKVVGLRRTQPQRVGAVHTRLIAESDSANPYNK